MEIVGVVLAVLVFALGPKAPDQSRCERERDGQACWNMAFGYFMKLNDTRPKHEREELKQKAGRYVKLGCEFGHQRSCEDYQKYRKYLDETP